MPADAWLTLAVITVMVATFVTERIAPVVSMAGAVTLLYLADVVEFDDAFAGLSNSAPVTVAALYIVAGAAELTGALGGLTARALGEGRPTSVRRAQARVIAPTVIGSGLVANTPLVALLAPRVSRWGRRHGIAPSQLLMPLSYAAVLGGVVTVLGTSTNLVVNGFLEQSGDDPFSVFSITPVGLPVAVAGAALLVVIAPVLLPGRAAPADDLAQAREYTVEMLVDADSALIGRSVAEANLRDLDGVYLTEIERDGQVIAPVAPDQRLRANDRLIFAGNIGSIIDLQTLPGISMPHDRHFAAADHAGQRFFEAVVAGTGPLAGRTLKQAGFRNRHQGAVVAVHRAGTRLTGKLGEIVMREGDVLLLVAEPGFRARTRDLPDFSLVAALDDTAPVRQYGIRLVEATVVALVVIAGTGLVDLTKTAVGAALFLVIARVLTPSEARRAINLDVILMIAFSFGLGNAAAASGLASELGEDLVRIFDPLGPVGILAGVMLGTLIATELLSNNAAAALMFPIAAVVSEQADVDLRSLAVGILVMASCSFLTPIGYQTNTMVWGMGGYRFTDFTRVGAPLTVVVYATTLLTVPLVFPL